MFPYEKTMMMKGKKYMKQRDRIVFINSAVSPILVHCVNCGYSGWCLTPNIKHCFQRRKKNPILKCTRDRNSIESDMLNRDKISRYASYFALLFVVVAKKRGFWKALYIKGIWGKAASWTQTQYFNVEMKTYIFRDYIYSEGIFFISFKVVLLRHFYAKILLTEFCFHSLEWRMAPKT